MIVLVKGQFEEVSYDLINVNVFISKGAIEGIFFNIIITRLFGNFLIRTFNV